MTWSHDPYILTDTVRSIQVIHTTQEPVTAPYKTSMIKPIISQ